MTIFGRRVGLQFASLAGLFCMAFSAFADVPANPIEVRFVTCETWGLCRFSGPDRGGESWVRLSGAGDDAWDGHCLVQGPAAIELRDYVSGVLQRAGRIELRHRVHLSGKTARASAWVDGIALMDIVIHAGVGRSHALSPRAGPCD